MTFNERDWDRIDSAVERAATRIDEELEKLVRRLPPNVTASMALGLLARSLNEKHPMMLKWLDPANARIRSFLARQRLNKPALRARRRLVEGWIAAAHPSEWC